MSEKRFRSRIKNLYLLAQESGEVGWEGFGITLNITLITILLLLLYSHSHNDVPHELCGTYPWSRYEALRKEFHHEIIIIIITVNTITSDISVIFWFLRNPTYHRSIFIVFVYVYHTYLFSTRLIFQITLYTTKRVFALFARAQLRI